MASAMPKGTRDMHGGAAPTPRRKDDPGERRCGVCQMKLSAYNPGPNCWQHTIGYPYRGPTAKPRF
jgi:hypothetical protein